MTFTGDCIFCSEVLFTIRTDLIKVELPTQVDRRVY